MLYFSENVIDQLLLEDISLGDLTTRSLGVGSCLGTMEFILRNQGRISGVKIACMMLKKLGLSITFAAKDGTDAEPNSLLLAAKGEAGRLHQGWKAAQNVLEWSCGVSTAVAKLLAVVQAETPCVNVACTRKSIPGTKLLAQEAVLHGGGIVHRGGMAETILVFANHRSFWSNYLDFCGIVKKLRTHAPEKMIVVEADSMDEAVLAVEAGADVVQLDKFTPEDVARIVAFVKKEEKGCQVIAAGGINEKNAGDYAKTGVSLLVTSAPYYASPADVKVILSPTDVDGLFCCGIV